MKAALWIATGMMMSWPVAAEVTAPWQDTPPKESAIATATKKAEPAEKKAAKKKDEKTKEKTIAESVKGHTKMDGIFTLYQDPKNGSLSMVVNKEQLNKEFIYFAFVQNGVLEAFYRRGNNIAQDVIELRKYYDRIEIVKINTNYIIDEASTLAKGGFANITDAVLASVKIKAKSKDGEQFLIPVDALFQTEALAQITRNANPNRKPNQQFSLGKLAKNKVKYSHLGVYPENMNIRTDYVYQNPRPWVSGTARVADARSTTITVQHSFLNMPENDFIPRLDDARIGFFGAQITDLNSYEFTPYADLISRWHLVKKDPSAALSEPVEPITWWIENTTPHEYREIMKNGILSWNSSFEKAGFKNAVVVKIQPDDADWSADDVRYNVVRWSNTPNAGSAFGPSYINPRTGQILGADVMFEHSFLAGYGFTGDVVANASPMQSEDDDSGLMDQSIMKCSLGHEMREMANFGHLALTAMGADVSAKRKIIEQMLYELMLHEVGHTFGLMHNMKGSNLHPNTVVHDDTITNGMTTASVMDYTALIVAQPGEKQGDFFTTKPGPYDDWAIQFGYDPTVEGETRDALLARSTERELMFGNDADDMRSPGAGIDPYVNIWDMSSDSMAFAEDQFDLVEKIAPMLKEKMADDGASQAKLRAALGTIINYKSRPAQVIANFIGGVSVDRAVQGQEGASQSYTPVAYTEQKRAMQILRNRILAPGAFTLPGDLIASAGMQRRGFDHYGTTEDPKIHSMILRIQQRVFNRLLNPRVMTRLTDTMLYGNRYSVDMVLSDLTDAVFEADLKGSVASVRQNLQVAYINRLSAVMASKTHDTRSKAATYSQLRRIQDWMSSNRRSDTSTKAHRQYIAHLITKTLDQD